MSDELCQKPYFNVNIELHTIHKFIITVKIASKPNQYPSA